MLPKARRVGAFSPHAIGRAFELATLAFLRQAPLSLQGLVHVGQAYDSGVDIRAWWPRREGSPPPRWGVVVQCKAERARTGPGVVRELEGVVGHQKSAEGTHARTVGMLVSQSGFSDEARRRAEGSAAPLALVHLARQDGDKTHRCEMMTFNRALRDLVGDSRRWNEEDIL